MPHIVILDIISLFLVELSTLLGVLKVPGTEDEWRGTFRAIMDNLWAEGGARGVAWQILQFVGAPGSKDEWNRILETFGQSFEAIRLFLIED